MHDRGPKRENREQPNGGTHLRPARHADSSGAVGALALRSGAQLSPLAVLALQRTVGNAAVVRLETATRRVISGRPPGHSAGAAAVQRLAAQITELGDGGVVTALEISGRPASPFSGTMGDHSTGFLVQVQAVRNTVLNRTPAAAGAQFLQLLMACQHLPGYSLIDAMSHDAANDDHVRRLRESETLTAQLAQAFADGRVPEADQLPRLQELVTAFLTFRELIPLTTFRTNTVDQSGAGKGHGEAGPAGFLANFDQRLVTAGEPTSDDKKKAVLALLDVKGLARVAAQADSRVSRLMAPGLDPTMNPPARRDLVIAQHLGSIDMAYPRVRAALWESAAAAGTWLAAAVQPYIEQRLEKERTYHEEQVKKVDAQMRDLLGAGTRDPHTLMLTGDALAAWDRLVADRANKVENARVYGGTVDDAPMHTPLNLNRGRPQRAKRARQEEPPSAAAHDGGRRSKVANWGTYATLPTGSSATSSSSRPTSSRSGKDAVDEDAMVESAVDEQATTVEAVDEAEVGNLVAQLELRDGKIGRLVVEGRPQRAFGTSMGAHTTAWIVHVDAVRRALEGCTPVVAVGRIEALAHETDESVGPLTGAGLTLSEGRIAHMVALRGALLNAITAARGAHAVNKPFLLQRSVVLLLAYTESLPGATINAVNTNGHGEGGPATALRAHESNPAGLNADRVAEYVWALLDIRSVGDENQRKALRANHRRVIRRAYPEAARKLEAARGTGW